MVPPDLNCNRRKRYPTLPLLLPIPLPLSSTLAPSFSILTYANFPLFELGKHYGAIRVINQVEIPRTPAAIKEEERQSVALAGEHYHPHGSGF
jgi:hypothetical protein